MANMSEQPCPADTLQNIKNCAGDALKLLGLAEAAPSPREAVAAINEYIRRWQKGDRPDEEVSDFEDSRLCMAALWGEQMAEAFQWGWAWVTFHDYGDSRALGVFSPDRSLATYPFEFLLGCMRDPGVPVTILLAYNMLAAGKIPAFPPRSYQNLMEGVRHIVPPCPF